MSERKYSVLTVAAAATAGATLAAVAVAGNYMFNYALNPKSRKSRRSVGHNGNPAERDRLTVNSDNRWLYAQSEERYIISDDRLSLFARFIPAESNTYVIAVHGYRATGDKLAGFARRFHNMGHNVLLPDLRGHGLSDGKYIGMGWHDRRDIVKWCRELISHDKNAKIVLFGSSMGATAVMMAAGEPDLPREVCCVIEDCGYSSVRDEFSRQLRERFNLPEFPVMYAASVISLIRAGFSFGQADAVKQIVKCRIPILFIHGTDDRLVPYSMLEPLYEAATCPKHILTVPGAGHEQAAAKAPALYWNTVSNFIADAVAGGAE